MKASEQRSRLAAVTMMVICSSDCVRAEKSQKPESALTNLQRRDSDVFTLEVEMELPAFALIPGQGDSTQNMRITVGTDVFASVWKATKLPPPKYHPPDTAGYQSVDYDADGNLILSMWSEGAALRDRATNEEYLESTGFRVASDGSIAGELSGATLQRYASSYSHTSGTAKMHAIRCALGRLSPDDLDDLEREDEKPDGLHELRVSGRASPYSGLGVWNLTVDSSNGNLLRHASFGAREGSPREECSSQGTRWFGNLALAERGAYTSGPQRISVRLLSFKPELDPGIIAEAQRMISRAKTRTVQVIDYRDDPAKPRFVLVPAGDLDKK